jgi:hypothetical protein
LIVFSLYRESFKLILIDEPLTKGILSQGSSGYEGTYEQYPAKTRGPQSLDTIAEGLCLAEFGRGFH